MNTKGSFGGWLKQRRKALDLTQAELADQVGCTVTTIQKIEADLRRPSKQIAEQLADALVVSPDEKDAFVSFARRLTDPLISLPIHLTSPMPASNLPMQSTPFLGRETELAQIATLLADQACRLLTLIGVGGIGKTRLAVQAAADRVEDFANGVYFVSLTPVGSTTLIAAAIASALQLSFHGQQDPNTQVVNYLRGKHMLLIMDNYEHLLPEIALLNALLANTPRLKILATSRERLNLHEEWVLQVEGLSFPTQSTNEEVGTFSAVQLFMQTARRLQPNFSLEANQNSVIDICQAVEGMPLGIELASTWLRAMPCQQIAGQIRRDLNFLTTPLRDVPERHRSLRAVFEHSWGLLSEVERSVLMKLSVFRGGIDPDAAEHVAQAPLWMLAGLVDKSLVRINASGRFELHELLCQFAADKLLEAGEMAQTELHHFQYFLGVAEQLEQWFFGPQHLIGMDRLEAELDNFRAALQWASRDGDAGSGLRLASALGWFWNRRAYWKEGHAWLEKFWEESRDVPVSVRALALHHLLELSNEIDDATRVIALYEEGVARVGAVEDPWVTAWLLTSLGYVGMERTEPHLAYLEQALALFTMLGDQWGMCETLCRLGAALTKLDDFGRAGKLLEEGIRLARQAGDKSVLSWTLMKLGHQNWFQGRMDARIESIYQESLVLFRELQYKNGIHVVLCVLGHIAHFRVEDERAKTLFEQSLRLGQQIGNSGIFVTLALINLSDIFCTRTEVKRGVCLLGVVDDLIRVQFAQFSQFGKIVRMDFERALAAAHAQLDEATFAAAYAQGQMMSLDQAVAYALANIAVTPHQEVGGEMH